MQCIYCGKALRPNFKIMLINTLIFTFYAAILIKTHTRLEYAWVVAFAFLCAAVVTPLLDVLFPLEEEKEGDEV